MCFQWCSSVGCKSVRVSPVASQCGAVSNKFLQWHSSVGLFQLSFSSGVLVYPASIRWVAHWYPSAQRVNQWHSSVHWTSQCTLAQGKGYVNRRGLVNNMIFSNYLNAFSVAMFLCLWCKQNMVKNNNHWGWRIWGVNWLVRNSLMSTQADERIRCWLPQIHIAGNHHWTWTTCICQSPENSEPQHEHLNFIRMCFSNVLVSAKRLAITKKTVMSQFWETTIV